MALATVATLAIAGGAQAQIAGASSDTNNVNIGPSTVDGGPHRSGRPGIGVPNTGLVTRVDFEGLQASSPPNADGVTTITRITGTTTDHSRYGRFDFAKVGSADLYFGEWSQTGSATAGDHTVYYAGTSTGTTVPTSGSATYAVRGISDYANKGLLTGTFTANFASGSSGTLTGSIANSASGYGVNIGTATIDGTKATFSGSGASATQSGTTVASGGTVDGRFYGANAAALAGIATFGSSRQYDTAFGGTKN
ncbi:Slam-dependent surface lipoprotein [Sphingomonas sp. CD22]|uniref:Slam-dependent surface lipoprotein n=1 Tax=Sphingomonas sp. CD22 TaxID=3100214 RepID=UPI002AE0750F|nr:Slam-dependent surface lipoprotein [Sphingomonas sp. CD22]MEA1084438.1 Slam-dependent surface lipoprotein [Sphingomonas sp. CD22]